MIRNKKTTSKLMSLLSALVAASLLTTTIFASGVLSDMTADDYKIDIIGIDGNVIELNNKPFLANGQMYVPLREMIGKVGYTDETSSIEWKDGTIDITLINYPADNAKWMIQIGSPMLSFRRFQGNQTINYQLTTDEYISIVSIKKNDAPMILENSTTYIPLEQLNYMVYAFTNKRNPETKTLYEITYKVYDKSGNEINIQDTDVPNLNTEYRLAPNTQTTTFTQPIPTNQASYAVKQFFSLFARSDFEKQKPNLIYI